MSLENNELQQLFGLLVDEAIEPFVETESYAEATYMTHITSKQFWLIWAEHIWNPTYSASLSFLKDVPHESYCPRDFKKQLPCSIQKKGCCLDTDLGIS